MIATAEKKVFTPPQILVRREAERILAARHDPNAFISYVYLDGRPQKRFHADMQNFYTNNNRFVIDCSIEHGKTEQISVWRSTWELGIDPELRFMLLSSKAQLGSDILTQLEELVQNEDLTDGRLHRVFPMLRPEDRPKRKTQWNTKGFIVRRELNAKDPSFIASGLKGTVMGGRKDRIIGDDVMNWDNTFYKTERDRAIGWFRSSECLGRATAVSKVGLVNSPWHPEALSEIAVRDMGFKHLGFRACNDNFGDILWPTEESLGRIVGFDRARLLEKQLEMGPIEFARCFLGKPITSKTAYFDIDIMYSCVDQTGELKNGMTIPNDMVKICAIDPAMGKAKSNETVLFHAGINTKNARRRLCKLIVGSYGQIETAKKILEIFRLEPTTIFVVESNAQQDFMIQLLRNKDILSSDAIKATEAEAARLPGLIRPFYTDRSKIDPDAGIPAMMGDFEAGLWEIPKCYEVERWFRQAIEYRPGTHTGDILMASYLFNAMAIELTRGANKIPPIVRRYANESIQPGDLVFEGIMEKIF